jgi:hypothetical protein
MAFRMVCPKCNGSDFSIERDRRAYAHGMDASDMLFSCRCGKRLFGDQVIQEFERQKKAWEADVEARAAEEAARSRSQQERQLREDQLRQVLASRARNRDEKRREDEARREEETRRWRARVEAAIEDVDDHDDHDDLHDDDLPAATPASAPAPAAAAAPSADAQTASTSSASGALRCAWHECHELARPNSKYCSRECSNKNARQRHRARKHGEDDVAAA